VTRGPALIGAGGERAAYAAAGIRAKPGWGRSSSSGGEAGIGNRPGGGARAQVRAEGFPRIAFRCSPYHTASAFSP